MIRRKLTLKRVDPWSVLKFGFVVNIALLLVGLLGFWILWTVVGRLGLVDQFCDSVGSIVLDLQECSLNGGNIFRTLLLIGLLGVVVQTGMMVFGAFLYNLIADLTGGLGFTFFDEAGDAATAPARTSEPATRAAAPAREAAPASTSAAAPAPTATQRPSDQSSAPARPTPDGPPRQPDSPPQSRPASPPTPSSDRSPSSTPTTNPGQRPSPGSSGSSGSLWGDPTRSNDRT